MIFLSCLENEILRCCNEDRISLLFVIIRRIYGIDFDGKYLFLL